MTAVTERRRVFGGVPTAGKTSVCVDIIVGRITVESAATALTISMQCVVTRRIAPTPPSVSLIDKEKTMTKRSKAGSGVDQEGASLRSANQQQTPQTRILATKRCREIELSDVPRHRDHWREWDGKNLCLTCGGAKEHQTPYHCDECYEALLPSLFDCDDD